MPSDVTAPKARPPLLEYGLLLALATIWGSSFTFLKISVISIPPITAAAMRALLACVLLYAILRVQGGRLPRDLATWRSFGALAAVNTLFPFILIAWGIQWVDASLTVILNSTTPIFAFLITWGITRHEAATARRLFGLMVGLLGIVLIVGATA
ncbi:MAG: DMT family transporter, partial [Hyphomicrobiaceae bacterium]